MAMESHQLEMTVSMTPDMANFSGNVHGGTLLKLLDQVPPTSSIKPRRQHEISIRAAAAVLCALALSTSAARADQVKILTTGILKGAFAPIAAEFERQSGHTVTMSWGPSSGSSPEASPVRVRSGEALDVLIMVDTGMDDLVRTGHFQPQHRRNVAVSRIGVAVNSGRPLPDIATPEAFRQTLLSAKSVGYSEGASRCRRNSRS